MLFSVLFIRTPLKSLEFYLFQPLGHGHAVQNCSPQLVNCCEEDNYKMLIIIIFGIRILPLSMILERKPSLKLVKILSSTSNLEKVVTLLHISGLDHPDQRLRVAFFRFFPISNVFPRSTFWPIFKHQFL